MTLRDRATTAAFRLGWRSVRALPARTAYALFDALADETYRRNTRDVARLRANYARVRPEATPAELDALVRAGLRSYLRYWCEAFRLPDYSAADIAAAVRSVGFQPVRDELAAGRSVVAFLGHLGNWDLAAAWSGTALAPVTTVAERLQPEELYQEFLAFRTALGMTALPLTGGPAPFPLLLDAVRGGGRLVPLLADRDLTARGVEVEFVGRRARMAPGPAALAVATGAPLHPITLHYEPVSRDVWPSGYRLVLTLHDRVADPGVGSERERVQAMTQACADVLGDVVRAHVSDWHMMQRVFVEDLDPVRTRRGA